VCCVRMLPLPSPSLSLSPKLPLSPAACVYLCDDIATTTNYSYCYDCQYHCCYYPQRLCCTAEHMRSAMHAALLLAVICACMCNSCCSCCSSSSAQQLRQVLLRRRTAASEKNPYALVQSLEQVGASLTDVSLTCTLRPTWPCGVASTAQQALQQYVKRTS
jgi:hypothetical protein